MSGQISYPFLRSNLAYDSRLYLKQYMVKSSLTDSAYNMT